MSLTEDQQSKLVARLGSLLPELFGQEPDARALLVDIGRMRSRQSEWRNPAFFWEAELRALQLGAIHDGIPALVVAAAARLPGNDVLAALAEVTAPGRQASAQRPEEERGESGRAAHEPDLPEGRAVGLPRHARNQPDSQRPRRTDRGGSRT
ncbi:MAG TPA: effector-associated domain EAD1-containing protein [Streptosporangiaceae bacterium]|nr:effector-associated domain EAD1-containing protein [Streptosporangiaceae bacterium]